jgi:NAD(P)-dependent dehydrogenase (short-subunit alcohol dehydrogenase family)
MTSVATATRTVVKHLGDGGRIILISSIAADRTSYPSGDYAATKAALEAYGRVWVHEFGPRGITVNTVQLGPIETDMLDQASAAAVLPSLPMRPSGSRRRSLKPLPLRESGDRVRDRSQSQDRRRLQRLRATPAGTATGRPRPSRADAVSHGSVRQIGACLARYPLMPMSGSAALPG